MESTWIHQLEQWHEFYVLAGTAGVTLTSALFVVISLGPSIIASENNTGVRAFITPNVVYFTTVLVLSQVLLSSTIPREVFGWSLLGGAALSILYLWTTRAPRRWRENNLSVMDWIWYIALPYLAYILILIIGVGVVRNDQWALTGLAGCIVFMLVIGIRNAWDLAVWMPLQENQRPLQDKKRSQAESSEHES
jgi:hypothetical protein